MEDKNPTLGDIVNADPATLPPEVAAMQAEMKELGPFEWLKKFNLKRWRDQVDFHFGASKREVILRPDGSSITTPNQYDLRTLGGLQNKKVFTGIDTEHATKPLARNLSKRRAKNKLARKSRARNR
jgi:hypothetical protein